MLCCLFQPNRLFLLQAASILLPGFLDLLLSQRLLCFLCLCLEKLSIKLSMLLLNPRNTVQGLHQTVQNLLILKALWLVYFLLTSNFSLITSPIVSFLFLKSKSFFPSFMIAGLSTFINFIPRNCSNFLHIFISGVNVPDSILYTIEDFSAMAFASSS